MTEYRGGLLIALVLAPVLAFSASPAERFQESLDVQLQAGYDQPDAALHVLTSLAAAPPAIPGAARMILLTEGLVAAGAAREELTDATLTALTALSGDALAKGDAALVRAVRSDNRAETTAVVDAAQSALRAYHDQCPSNAGCDYRSSFRALQLLSRHDKRRAESGVALEHALAALSTARSADDLGREILADAIIADLSGVQGDRATEERFIQSARRLARQQDVVMSEARINPYEIAIFTRRGELAAARRAANDGIRLAAEAQSPRLRAQVQAYLADVELRMREPENALEVVHEALPIARRFGDRHLELVLLHNAALAHIAMGRTSVARQSLEQVLVAVHATGATTEEALVLREFGDALAATGDFAGAMDLYHRERALAATIVAKERDTALQALSSRYGRDAQQQQLDRLRQESKLLDIQLTNRRESQKVWIACSLLLALGVCLVALTYRQVKEANRELARNQASLRTLSQRDPLTGLANRLALHERAATIDAGTGFHGALMMVDIDHFKEVNDTFGHASGDKVLMEVARRLTEAVDKSDLIVRWGGEEFLIVLPAIEPDRLDALAARILGAVAGEAVALPGGPLRVTVSVGYAGYPLQPVCLPLALERATNFTDMALYEAKSQGRNQALGIVSVTAENPDALRGIEADFDQAWRDGLVILHRETGPSSEAPSTRTLGPEETLPC